MKFISFLFYFFTNGLYSFKLFHTNILFSLTLSTKFNGKYMFFSISYILKYSILSERTLLGK